MSIDITTFLQYFGTFAAFVAGVTTFTQFFKNLFKVEKKGWKIAIAYIIAVLGSLVGFYFQIGFLADYGTIDMWQGWVMTALTGAAAGTAACGFYDLDEVEKIVKWIWSFMKPDTPIIINE